MIHDASEQMKSPLAKRPESAIYPTAKVPGNLPYYHNPLPVHSDNVLQTIEPRSIEAMKVGNISDCRNAYLGTGLLSICTKLFPVGRLILGLTAETAEYREF